MARQRSGRVEALEHHHIEWWPDELVDCEWRMSPNIWLPPHAGRPRGAEIPHSGRIQVRPRGAGEDAWRDPPTDPLDETWEGSA